MLKTVTPANTVAIIGGGPAGLALSIHLKQQKPELDVVIFDNTPTRRLNIGESIPPAATQYLKALFQSDFTENMRHHLICPGSISIWGSETPGHNDFMFDLEGSGYHLDREHFNQQLTDVALRHGVDIRQHHKLIGVSKISQGYDIQLVTVQRKKVQFKATFVIDSSGKPAHLCRKLNIARNVLDEVLYLCCVIDLPSSKNVLPQTLVEATANGWWYSAKIPNEKLVITFCVDQSVYKTKQLNQSANWLHQLYLTCWLKNNIPIGIIAQQVKQSTIHVLAAPSMILSNVVGEGWLALGDSASSYDPISSAGITKALIHSEVASQAIIDYLHQGNSTGLLNYQDRVFKDFNTYCSLRHRLYHNEQRFNQSSFWHHRQKLCA